MMRLFLKFGAMLLTFAGGVAFATISFTRSHTVKPLHTPCETVSPPPAAPSATSANNMVTLKEGRTPTPTTTLQSLSPYAIEAFINQYPQADIKSIWERLKVRPDDGVIPPFFERCEYCTAETFEYDLDGEFGDEVLLRVTSGAQEAYRYLVFKLVGESFSDGWKLLGHVDIGFSRSSAPRHYILAGGGKTWLVVRVQDAAGSGNSLYTDRVFEVSSKRIKEVLDFVSSGYHSGLGGAEPSSGFGARIVNVENREGVETMVVEFSVVYSLSKETEWSKDHKAVYVKRAGRFVFDPHRSELSEKELKAVYNNDYLSEEDFLKYNYQALSRLTRSRDSVGKAWLWRTLPDLKYTKEKSALLKSLRR